MSTTRTTSESAKAPGAVPSRVPYTVIGGPRWDRVRKYPYSMTLLVMSRGDRLFRAELLSDLLSRDLGEVLWVEGHEPSADVESLARDHPDVRFLLLKEPTTAGERINIGIAEARSPVALCLWSDMRLSRVPAALPEALEKSGVVCTVPLSRNARLQPIPSWQSPVWKKRRLSLAFRIPRREGEPTLFPFDYCGIYNSERFLRTGGFDPSISNPYWQKLDFGFRCFLWGERIAGTTEVSLTYTASPPTDDSTPDQSYKLFFLKNMAVRMRREMGVLPVRRILDYIVHSDASPLYSLREFAAARDWVRTHKFRFRKDPRDVMQKWEGAE